MRKELILFLIIIFGVCLICGCVNQSQSSPQKSVGTPIPTLKTQFNLNEPATDGNLRITVINVHDVSGPIGRSRSVTLKIENLKSDRVIHILVGDFRLIDDGGIEYTNGEFQQNGALRQDKIKFDLNPNQREQIDLMFFFKGAGSLQTFNKLKFDFSGSGGNAGSPIVYFNL